MAALLALVSACGPSEAEQAQAADATRTAIADASATADRAAATPSTGLWTPDHLVERLVRAGVAPRRVVDAPAGPDWMQGERLAFHAGGGELFVWIYADSAARRAVSATLDPTTATPRGRAIPYEMPLTFVVQNNLAAVITGGTERNHERIALALQAGLPVTAPSDSASKAPTP